jgi:hypothetical protein
MQRGIVPLSGVSECGLPRELWEVIFALVDESALSVTVPRVSVFCHKQCFDNAALWRRKCVERYGPSVVRPDRLTWKQHYFSGADLFPYRGITVGVTTYEQLISIAGAVSNSLESGARYVTIDHMNFWLHNTDQDICNSVNLSQRIPTRWHLKGLSWQGSYRSYKALFQRWHGNYRVTERPRTKQLKKNKQQWSAALTSVGASHSAPRQYYQISLSFFSLTGGSEDRTGLLSSMSISVHNAAALEQTYNARELVD